MSLTRAVDGIIHSNAKLQPFSIYGLYGSFGFAVCFSGGNILSYGSEDVIICPNYEYETVIDCKGGAVLPGRRIRCQISL